MLQTDLAATLGEAMQKAVAAEQLLTEQLAYAVLERDHPARHRPGSWAWHVGTIKKELADAQMTTDALARSLNRVRATQPKDQ